MPNPIITVPNGGCIQVAQGSPTYLGQGVTAVDTAGNNVPVIMTPSTVSTATIRSVPVTFTAEDGTGNTAAAAATVEVVAAVPAPTLPPAPPSVVVRVGSVAGAIAQVLALVVILTLCVIVGYQMVRVMTHGQSQQTTTKLEVGQIGLEAGTATMVENVAKAFLEKEHATLLDSGTASQPASASVTPAAKSVETGKKKAIPTPASNVMMNGKEWIFFQYRPLCSPPREREEKDDRCHELP